MFGVTGDSLVSSTLMVEVMSVGPVMASATESLAFGLSFG